MREIKFRAWERSKKVMITSRSLGFEYHDGKTFGFTVGDLQHCFPVPKENIVLMQYTGLKDKNGTEIYEGDIVKWTRVTFEDCSRTTIKKTEDIIGEVYWAETMWAIRQGGVGYLLMPYFVESDEFEILGNKYEHPHLLGSGEE